MPHYQTSQNCDNFLSEKSSTGLHHAPGGASSFGAGLSFGGDDTVERSVTTGQPINQGKRDHNARSEDQAHGFRAKGSNAHATGTNQNCGNFLTDRPTSKVLSAPGGASSFGAGLSFGGDDTSAIKKSNKRDPNARSTDLAHGFRAKGSNAHANGGNQNCGNHLTDRPTSRVLAPPGGGSSISFGDASAPVVAAPVVAAPVVAAPLADVSNKPVESSIFNVATKTTEAHGFRAKGSNAHATGTNQNCGNFLTDRPTSRVLAPPGGGSSISFG